MNRKMILLVLSFLLIAGCASGVSLRRRAPARGRRAERGIAGAVARAQRSAAVARCVDRGATA